MVQDMMASKVCCKDGPASGCGAQHAHCCCALDKVAACGHCRYPSRGAPASQGSSGRIPQRTHFTPLQLLPAHVCHGTLMCALRRTLA